jgi:MSHA biogenesis protein MshP
MRRRQTGFGAIAAIMILVILASLAAAIVSLGAGQQLASAQDVLSAEAWQVASAGTEDGLFQALRNANCGTATWNSPDYPHFRVTIACTAHDYNDGETAPGVARVLRVFQVVATACNGTAATCPDDAASAGLGYIERQAVAVAYCEWNGAACVP